MTSALVSYLKSGNLPAIDAKAKAAALAEAAADESTGGGEGFHYVTFSGKSGELVYGKDRKQLPQDEAFLLDPDTISRGWVCWKGGSVAGRHEWPATEHATKGVHASQLEDKGPYAKASDGWKSTLGFGFLSTEHAEGEAPEQYKFSNNSVSGKNAISDLIDEIADRMRSGEPFYPVFYFTREKFQAQGEWNWKPKFSVDEWLYPNEAAALLGVPELDAVEPEEEPEVAPAKAEKPKRTRTKAKPKDDPEYAEIPFPDAEVVDEEPAPRPRRTRRA